MIVKIVSSSSYIDSLIVPAIIHGYKNDIEYISISPEYHAESEIYYNKIKVDNSNSADILFVEDCIKGFTLDNSIRFKIVKNSFPLLTKKEARMLSSRPAVIIIGVGKCCQISNIELLLNDEIQKHQVKAIQWVSHSFLMKRIDDEEYKDYEKPRWDCFQGDFCIIGIECDSITDLLSHDLYDIVHEVSLDYLLLCMENNEADIDMVNKICAIKFGRKPNSIVFSDYFSFKSSDFEIPIYDRPINNLIIRGEYCNVSRNKMGEVIFTNIMNTITSIKKWASIT